MVYLDSESRKKVILNAAIKVALREGFSAMTVRKIATEGKISIGQIHHHFSSVDELMCKVFMELTGRVLGGFVTDSNKSWRENLISFLFVEDETNDDYLRLFREARVLINYNKLLLKPYFDSLNAIHHIAVGIIKNGIDAGEFRVYDTPENISWRLISFTIGFDELLGLNLFNDDIKEFKENLQKIVDLEIKTD